MIIRDVRRLLRTRNVLCRGANILGFSIFGRDRVLRLMKMRLDIDGLSRFLRSTPASGWCWFHIHGRQHFYKSS